MPSTTALDVFCVLSVAPSDAGELLDDGLRGLCAHLMVINYTVGHLSADVGTQLKGFPYDRANDVDAFPSAYNLANQLRAWKEAWALIEAEERRAGVEYRTITRFRPDTYLASSVKIDRDSWSKRTNWERPRATYAFSGGALHFNPFTRSRLEDSDFIVMPATEQWVFPWSDQVAFGGRRVMKWYLTAMEAVDLLPRVSFHPETLLGDVLLFQAAAHSQPFAVRTFSVYTPKEFVTCICRASACSGECVARRFVWSRDDALWSNAKRAVFTGFLCPDEELNAFLVGDIIEAAR